MWFPKLEPAQASREMLTVFRGFNANPRISEGEFAAMENMSAEGYPLLTPRRKRAIFARPDRLQGLTAKESVCWVDGSKFVLNGYPVELHLSTRAEDCPKRMVSMGAYVVIFPDKKYINTLDISDTGNLEAEFTAESAVFQAAEADGTPLIPAYVQPEAPENPENMALWLDNSANVLMQWSGGTGMWVEVEQTFVRISAPGIGGAFRVGDGVTLEGVPAGVPENAVITACGADFVAVPGLLSSQIAAGVTISRRLPPMDFVIECGNRLWGCRYGVNAAGDVVNEIYASKLGDFRNWNCFAGISTDSYIMSLGADGPFTGAAAHMGYPIFFRENCLHKVYGSYPANFRLQTTPCQGVQRGSSESVALVGEVLFYKSPFGVCAYDGALPVEISRDLGQMPYHGAAAGSLGGRYYISMADAGGEYHLFVYDRARNLWHREDGTRALSFCTCREALYYRDADGTIRTVGGTGEAEPDFGWMAETGDIGVESPDNKYLSRLTLRLWLGKGAKLRIAVRYDEDPVWHVAGQLTGGSLGSVTLPLGVRRCDHLRLRLDGRGDMRLYSITKTVEEGSDVF